MQEPVRAVLFDFGGTLCGREPLADIDAAAHTPAELGHGRVLDADVWQRRWRDLDARADVHAPGLGRALLDHAHDPLAWRPSRNVSATLRALRDAGLRSGVVSSTGWACRAFGGRPSPHGDGGR